MKVWRPLSLLVRSSQLVRIFLALGVWTGSASIPSNWAGVNSAVATPLETLRLPSFQQVFSELRAVYSPLQSDELRPAQASKSQAWL